MTEATQQALDLIAEHPVVIESDQLLSAVELERTAHARIVTTVAETIAWLNDEPSIALDLETIGPGPRDGLSPWKGRIAVMALYGPRSNTCAVLHDPAGPCTPELLRWLESRTPEGKRREYVTHNGANFDILFLQNAGMDVSTADFVDTLIGEQVSLSSGRKNVSVALGKVFERRLGQSLKGKVDHAAWANAFLTQEQMDYVTGDIKYLHAVRDEQIKKCAGDSRTRAMKVEMRLLPILVGMTMHGMPVDMMELDRYLTKQHLGADKAKKEIIAAFETPEINLNSTAQIKAAFARLGFEIPNTRVETIVDIAQEYAGTPLGDLCSSIREHRYANQRIKMFSPDWISDNILYNGVFGAWMVHPRFRSMGTDTGRFSCNTPNFQQTPRDMRTVFGNLPGYKIVSVDYSAIEVRVAAALANDEVMIEAFSKQDIHTFVASQIFQKPEAEITQHERKIAKSATFTLLFGGGAATLQSYAKIKGGATLSLAEAKEIVVKFFQTFQGLAKMRQQAYWVAENSGPIALTLPTGVRRVLIGAQLTPQRYLNTLVQGTAAAFMKYAIIDCAKTAWGDGKLADYLCATVHDELVALVPDAEAEAYQELLRTVMIEAAYRTLGHRRVPIDAGGQVGVTWAG